MKFSIFSIIAVTASIVSTVSAQELPPCAKTCVSEVISKKLLTCTSPDAACVCSGTKPAVRNVAACVQGTCTQLDLQEFVKQVLALCGDAPTTTTTGGAGKTTGTATTKVTAPTGGNTTTSRTTTTSATTVATTTVTGNFTLTTTRTTTGTTTVGTNGTTTTTSATTTTSSEGAAVKIMGGSGAAGMGSVAIALVVAAFLG